MSVVLSHQAPSAAFLRPPMRVPRFFVDTRLDQGAVGREIPLPEAVAHHACRVLRRAAGDALTLFDGQGGEYAATLTRVDRRGAWAHLQRFDALERESPLPLTLVLGIAATDAMDYAVRKAVELGAAAIRPVVTTRGARMPTGERGEKRHAHWRQIAVAACEQCGRNRVPPVREAISLAQWLAGRDSTRPGYMLAPEATESLARTAAPAGEIDVAIGPEGGWTADELIAAGVCRIDRRRFRPARAAHRNRSGRGAGNDRRAVGRLPMMRNCLALSMLAALLGGCAHLTSPEHAPADYRFVVLGPDGGAVARLITMEANCPALDVDGAMRPMTVRMPPQTMPLRPTRSTPSMSRPSAFPVLTCEAPIPAGTRNAAIGGHPLPLPKANPRRIVVIGDTGCRIKTGDNAFQSCDDPAQWPFERIADAAAATAPDLVVHVGDYHYRENACPATHPGCFGSPWGYGWDAWQADFFHPARRLLEAAPWIVVRGNHESCDRAGQGWWRFLDPRPLAPRQDCNDAADDAVGEFSEPYAVPLGDGSDAQFVVFDSSRVGLTALAPDSAMHRTYRAQFERAFALAAAKPQAHLLVHHPVLGFAANPGKPAAPYPGNRGLQSVLEPLHPTVLFPPQRAGAFFRAQPCARGGDVLDRAAAAVHGGQRRRHARPAVSGAVSRGCRTRTRRDDCGNRGRRSLRLHDHGTRRRRLDVAGRRRA